MNSVESVLRPEESLWWWGIFVEEVGFEPGAGESDELTEEEDVIGAGKTGQK